MFDYTKTTQRKLGIPTYCTDAETSREIINGSQFLYIWYKQQLSCCYRYIPLVISFITELLCLLVPIISVY